MRERNSGAESGFVLIATLWMLAALAALVSIYSAYAVTTAAGSHVADDRVQAEASIRSGLEMTVFHLLSVSETERPASGRVDIRVGRTAVAVRFLPEDARIDLNAAPADLFAGLFTQFGIDSEQAEYLAARVVGWRAKPDPAHKSEEAEHYAKHNLPYGPRQGSFASTLELSLLPGMPPAVVQRVLPYVTVFSRRAELDIATADPVVLSALPGMTRESLATVLKARSGEPGDPKALLAQMGALKERLTADRPNAIRAIVDVTFDNGRRIRAQTVIRLLDKGDEPYEILYWQDDFDDPASSA